MDTPQPQNEASFPPTWVIMPILAHLDYTKAAIADVLAQSVPVRLLLINQGADEVIRGELERIAEADDRIFLWSHQPPLPSLAATWNTALDFVWAVGGDCALVVNNDVRLRPDTIDLLRRVIFVEGDFVSCVGVTPEQFNPTEPLIMCDDPDAEHPKLSKGGPDFSCFLISRTCHTAYRFDEGFIPAFCEDLDYHRRMLLAGDGHLIFSINLPYLHYGSATLKAVDDRQRTAINSAIQLGSRAHYHRKWGGEVNDERLTAPFGQDGQSGWNDGRATTPSMQARVARGLPPIGCPSHDAEPFDDCSECRREMQEAQGRDPLEDMAPIDPRD